MHIGSLIVDFEFYLSIDATIQIHIRHKYSSDKLEDPEQAHKIV